MMDRKYQHREEGGAPPCVRIVGLFILLVLSMKAGGAPRAAVAQSSDSLVFDVQGMPLGEALGRAADVMQLDLAFAPDRVAGRSSTCAMPLSAPENGGESNAEAVLRCVLRGTELEARRLGGGAFVIARPTPTASSEGTHGVVRGVVRDRSTRAGLANVNVILIGTRRGAASDRQGAFRISRVPPGRYVLQVTRVGFTPATVGPVRLMPTDTLDLDVALTERAIPMEGAVVTPRLTTETLVREVTQTIPAANYQSVGVAGVSVGLLVSADEAVRRVQFSPLGNLAGTDLRGAQFSGGVNAAGGSAHGVQVGGWGNLAGVGLRGVQIGGAGNAVEGTLQGVQASGSVNVAYGAAQGAQLGGAVNVAGRLSGSQLGGAVNVATGATRGVQVAGALNIGHDAVRGVQLAGGINLARRQIDGVQVAPLNIAGTVRGLQVGVVNVARRYRGVPIGVVSYVHEVGLRYDTWIDASGMTTVALRSGTHHVSNFLGVGVRLQGTTRQVASVAGLGITLAPRRRLSGGLDLLSYSLINLPRKELGTLMQARFTAGYDVGGGFRIAAGPTFNFWAGLSNGTKMVPWGWASGRIAGESYRIGPGFVLGLQLAR